MNILSLFDNILSVKDYGETHRVLRLFGLRIKFPKREFAKKKQENPYYYYKKNNIDITTIPSATGQIRDVQLANLALLKELDYVCKQNNLKYWIDFGSLLGAVRHKGFIPWDDDVDTGMLRDDYVQVVEAFKKSSRNPDIYADYVLTDKNVCYYIKVQHKKCPHLFVDIFPYDYYGEILTKEEQYAKTNEIKDIRKRMQKDAVGASPDEISDIILRTRNSILKNDNPSEKSDLVWGVDFGHIWKNWFYSCETIFPLRTIEFEGMEIPCINKAEEFLTEVYGNYMGYPNKIGVGHSMYVRLSDEEKLYIEKLKQEV